MKTFIAAIIITSFFGCTNSLSESEVKKKKITIFSDHEILSREKNINTLVENLLTNNVKEEHLVTDLYKDTWIYYLQSNIKWPNKLDIQVKEYQPVANWGNRGYLTHSGFIIHPTESNLDLDLVILSGPENEKFHLLDFSRRIQSQLNRFDETISELNISLEGYLTATTTKGVKLVFSKRDFRDQLERLEDFISFELFSGKLNDIKNIDLRYKNGISILFT